MELAIADIKVNNRRREDYGDIEALARSIAKHGLIHPIVVDEDWNLIAGERRLLACKKLGWEKIEVRFMAELSEKEKRAIELEENLQRKDLTEYEKSKNLVELAKVKAEELAREKPQVGGFGTASQNLGGRPPKLATSSERIAAEIGVDGSTLRKAQQHVAIVEAHPEVKNEPKSVALDYAKAVEEFPELKDYPPRLAVLTANDLRALPPREQEKARMAAATYPKIMHMPAPSEDVHKSPFFVISRAIEKFESFARIIEAIESLEDKVASLQRDERRQFVIRLDAAISVAIHLRDCCNSFQEGGATFDEPARSIAGAN